MPVILWVLLIASSLSACRSAADRESPPAGASEEPARAYTDLEGIAGPANPGDSLVLEFTTISGDTGAFYIPNGDGALVRGRIVNLKLP